MTLTTTDDPTEFRLARHNAVDLEFSGWLLADESTRFDRPAPARMRDVDWDEELGRARWSEVRIYRTESEKYVVEVIGASRRENDTNLITVRVVEDPAKVRDALVVGKKKQLMNVAVDALAEAAEKDSALRESTAERI